MNQHPVKTMLYTWSLCVLAFSVLPFRLLERELTISGLVILAAFIAFYVAGSMFMDASRYVSDRKSLISVEAVKVEKLLIFASALASVLYIIDAFNKSIFDLAVAYDKRSEAAEALLKADPSSSSVWFQLAFIFYPAGYIFIATHLLYTSKIKVWKVALFGFLPIVLATLSMGGRNPIFYALLVAWLAFKDRGKVVHYGDGQRSVSKSRKLAIRLLWFVLIAALLFFFATVFMVRADAMGGSIKMFMHAEQEWGVAFRGQMYGLIVDILGEDIAYLLFIFAWYLVQGFVMSSYLFSSYDGPLQLGAYGIDLLSALMRRLDADRLAEGFNSLLTLGTYGFLPSAWGALYVDFGFFGMLLSFIWGAFSALCFRRIVLQRREDWLLIGPFITIGIALSIINTPLGYTNGLVTHAWLLGAFLLLRRSKVVTKQALIFTK